MLCFLISCTFRRLCYLPLLVLCNIFLLHFFGCRSGAYCSRWKTSVYFICIHIYVSVKKWGFIKIDHCILFFKYSYRYFWFTCHVNVLRVMVSWLCWLVQFLFFLYIYINITFYKPLKDWSIYLNKCMSDFMKMSFFQLNCHELFYQYFLFLDMMEIV